MSNIAQKIFEKNNISVDVKTGLPEDEIIKIIPDYDGMVVRSATKVTKNIISAAKKLKVIGRAGAGDNVTVANGVTLGACTVALSNVTKPGSYFLTPAAPSKQATSMVRYMRRLPEIWQRLLKLEARLERSETTT